MNIFKWARQHIVDDLASEYKKQVCFDVLKYMVDAESAGVVKGQLGRPLG